MSLLGVILLPFVVTADNTPPNYSAPIKSVDQLYSILLTIAKIVRVSFFVFAALFIVIAAFNYLFAQGAEEKLKTAKTMLIYAIVAIAVALIATGLTAFIGNFITTQQ